MSGPEVVGVLLGAIPVVVAALKSYKEAKQRYIWFASKEVYVDRLIQSLNEQMFSLRADVGLALRAASLEPKRIIAFLDDPNLNPLGNVEVADALQEYLGDGFQLIVRDIVKNISGMTSDSKIKFSLRKDDLDAQIKGLDQATKNLSRISEQSARSEVVAIQSTSRSISRLVSALATIRESALRLYSAISLGYGDKCQEEHEAKLFLQTRSAIMQGSKQKRLRKPSVAFDLEFSRRPASAALSKNGWSSKTQVKVLEMGDSEDSGVKPDGRGTNNQAAVMSTPPPKEIENLCALIHAEHKTGTYSEILLGDRGNLCLAHCSAINPPPIQQETAMITLKQTFDAATLNLPKLPLNQRIALSFNIASSVMQLHSTPWLALPLTSSSIYFPHGEATTPASSSHQPFVRAIFADCRKGCPECHHKTRETMLALGILMLELWHAESIETFARDSGLQLSGNFGTRYDAAQQWIVQSGGDMLPFYHDAVTRCIECTFSTSSCRPDWGNV